MFASATVHAVAAALVAVAFAVPLKAGGLPQDNAAPAQQPLDVIYVPTPHEVVKQMLATARVGAGDVVFDLGSGDGRIPIAAVRDFGAARGIEVSW